MSTTLTLGDVLEEQRTATGRRDKDTLFIRGVNNALVELIYKVRMKEFHKTKAFSTVVDTPGYALDADEFAVINVRNLTDNIPLDPKEILQYDEIGVDPTTGAGAPTKWTQWANEVLLFDEIPDAVYSMQRRGLKRPTKLTDPTVVLPVMDEWDDVIVALSISKAFLSVGQIQEAGGARQQVDAIIAGRMTPEQIKKEHTSNQFFSFSDFSQK